MIWISVLAKGSIEYNPQDFFVPRPPVPWMTGGKQVESILANILGISSKSAPDSGWDETMAWKDWEESFNIAKRQIPLQREWRSQNTAHIALPCSVKWRPGHDIPPPEGKNLIREALNIFFLNGEGEVS